MEMIAPSANVETNAQSNAMTADSTKMAKLYFMISHSLYNDKKGSILRELASNCRDSHKEAGKLDTPFAIIAPTRQNPYLTVSDVGTGLTYEKAKTSILMFLGSTKDSGENAGDFIGGWGIGAKAPRAYRPDYQVILRKGGTEWVVQVFNDGSGFPQETLLLEHKTAKPDGVDIVVPIFDVDVAEWRTKVEEYVGKTSYNLMCYMGDGVVLLPTRAERTFDYGDFHFDVYGAMKASGAVGQDDRISVIYGGMSYEIPDSFGLASEVRKLKNGLAPGLNGVLRVERPDVLKFGLSREGLDLEPGTQRFLTNAVMTVAEDLAQASGMSTAKSPKRIRALTWKEVLEADEKFRAHLKETDGSKLASVSRKASCLVTWAPEGLKKDGYAGSKTTLKPEEQELALPLLRTEPKILVLYSDKRPTMSDYYSEGHGEKIVCPIKTPSEVEALMWAKGLEQFEGCSFEPRYVKSTRSVAKRKYSSTALQSRGVLTCAVRNKRYRLNGTKNLVIVDSEKDFWIEGVFEVTAVVMTKSAAKQGVPDDEDVALLEEFLEDPVTVSTLNRKYSGSEVSGDTLAMLHRMLGNMEACPSSWPEAVKNEREELVSDLSRTAVIVDRAKERMWELLEEFPDACPKFEHREGVWELMKRANDHIVVVNKNLDTFKLFNFEKIKEELVKDNPEARRLVCAMRLEEFL